MSAWMTNAQVRSTVRENRMFRLLIAAITAFVLAPGFAMAQGDPGKTQAIVWQFTKPGEFWFGCLIPGRFEVGMVGRIYVR